MSLPCHSVAPGSGQRPLIIALTIFLAALLLRLHGIGARPFWYDEILTVHRAALPWRAMLGDALREHHSPLYFLAVAPFDTGRDPQFWLRLPSAVLGAAAVLLAFLNARRVAGLGAGVAAALILGLTPTQIAYSQEARSYALVIVAILLALHGLLGLVLSRDRAALRWQDAGAPLADWGQFVGGSALALGTLADSLPWLLAANATAALMIRQSNDRRGLLRNMLLANAIMLLPCLPLYAAMVSVERVSPDQSFGFVPPTSLALIWFDIESIYLMRVADVSSFHLMAVPIPRLVAWIVDGGLVAAFAASWFQLRRDPTVRVALLFALLALPLVCGTISLFYPVMMVRYLLWSGPVFAILAGIGVQTGLRHLRIRTRAICLAAVAVLLLLNLAPFYKCEIKPRWDIAAAILAAQAGPDDVFYLSEPIAAATMRYYLPAPLQAKLLTDIGGDLSHAMQARHDGRHVWAIYGDAAQRTGWRSLPDFQASLTPLGEAQSMQQAGQRITLWRYN